MRRAIPGRTRRASCMTGCFLLCAMHAADAASPPRAATRSDQQFTNYAYAHEFGSGIYDYGGRTLQVYTLPFAWQARDRQGAGWGVRAKLPVTLGFLDFQTSDVLTSGLPASVDSASFVPGLELELSLGPDWTLRPYLQAGASLANEATVETRLIGGGLRAERAFPAGRYAGTYAIQATYSGVHYRGEDSLPGDDFVRLRNGLQWTRSTGRWLADHEVQFGLFAVADWYADPPTGPTTGVVPPAVQLELGVVFDTSPSLRVFGLPMPRVGLSYRAAGDVSSVRFVIGAPF